jgi:hypothetical protein
LFDAPICSLVAKNILLDMLFYTLHFVISYFIWCSASSSNIRFNVYVEYSSFVYFSRVLGLILALFDILNSFLKKKMLLLRIFFFIYGKHVVNCFEDFQVVEISALILGLVSMDLNDCREKKCPVLFSCHHIMSSFLIIRSNSTD